MPLTSNQIRALLWALIAVVSALLLSLLAPVLMPFLLAAVLAYALHPLVERLHARRVPRWLGAGLAIALLMLVLLAVMLLIVPVITKQVPLLREQVPLLLDRLNDALLPLATRFGVNLQVDVSQVREWLRTLITGNESELHQWPAVVAAHRRQRAGGGVRQPVAHAHRGVLPAAGLDEPGRRAPRA